MTTDYNARVPIGSIGPAPVIASREFLLWLQQLSVTAASSGTSDVLAAQVAALGVRLDAVDGRLQALEQQMDVVLVDMQQLQADLEALQAAVALRELDDEQGRALFDENGEELLA